MVATYEWADRISRCLAERTDHETPHMLMHAVTWIDDHPVPLPSPRAIHSRPFAAGVGADALHDLAEAEPQQRIDLVAWPGISSGSFASLFSERTEPWWTSRT